MSTEDQMEPMYSHENEYRNIDNKLESFAIPEILSHSRCSDCRSIIEGDIILQDVKESFS